MLKSRSIYENYKKGGIKTPLSQQIKKEDSIKRIAHFQKHKMINETIFEQISNSSVWIDEHNQSDAEPIDDQVIGFDEHQHDEIAKVVIQKNTLEFLIGQNNININTKTKYNASQKEIMIKKAKTCSTRESVESPSTKKNKKKIPLELQACLNIPEFHNDSMPLSEKMDERKIITKVKNPFLIPEQENGEKIQKRLIRLSIEERAEIFINHKQLYNSQFKRRFFVNPEEKIQLLSMPKFEKI